MGNKRSQLHHPGTGFEMSSAKEFANRTLNTQPLCNIRELIKDCLALKHGVDDLSQAIEVIFLNEDDSQEESSEIERRLHAIIRYNQAIVHRLTRNLERHAKVLDKGVERNELLMTIVKDLVSTINSCMTMLIRNIIKLKRLISEMNPSTEWASMPQRAIVYDVISDNQDVDVMLVQLLETESRRADLETNIVIVLACWRDYRHFLLATENHVVSTGEIENNVKTSADNVARSLARLKRYKR